MTTHTNHFQENLYTLLEEELACAINLSDSLKSEREALSSLDEQLINISSANKQKLIESLQQASKTRINLMAMQGYASSPAAIKQYIISRNCNPRLKALFTQLADLAQHCATENRLIGQLINRRTQFISKALNSLSPSENVQGLTYGENGSTSTSKPPHTLYSI